MIPTKKRDPEMDALDSLMGPPAPKAAAPMADDDDEAAEAGEEMAEGEEPKGDPNALVMELQTVLDKLKGSVSAL